MDCLSKYDDPTQYSLISERQNYENGYNIQTQILKEIDTDKLVELREEKFRQMGKVIEVGA